MSPNFSKKNAFKLINDLLFKLIKHDIWVTELKKNIRKHRSTCNTQHFCYLSYPKICVQITHINTDYKLVIQMSILINSISNRNEHNECSLPRFLVTYLYINP